MSLPQRFYLKRQSATLQSVPVLDQLLSMDLDPGCHKSRLLHRKFPTDEFDCVDRKYARLILEVRVKVRAVVRCSRLSEHPNHDPKESTNLGQGISPGRSRASSSMVPDSITGMVL